MNHFPIIANRSRRGRNFIMVGFRNHRRDWHYIYDRSRDKAVRQCSQRWPTFRIVRVIDTLPPVQP